MSFIHVHMIQCPKAIHVYGYKSVEEPVKVKKCTISSIYLLFANTGVYLLDFFCSGIQFNLLLSPYPCFISLLYLDLYVLGDDALIS